MKAKNFAFVVGLFMLFIMSAFQRAEVKERICSKDNAFAVTDKALYRSIGVTCQIESWLIAGDEIVITSTNPDSLFYSYSCKDFRRLAVYGRKGHGHNEFVSPLMFTGKSGSLLAIDNANMKVYKSDKGRFEQTETSRLHDALNDLKTISYPLVAYNSMAPLEVCLKIVNIESGQLVDSIAFKDNTGRGNAAVYDYAWDYNNGKIVIAHIHSEKFVVCNVNENGKILDITSFDSSEIFSKDKTFYTDVVCGEYIYLLSQKKVNVNDFSGYSEIEVYDYNGQPVKRIELDFISPKMLLDRTNNKLIFASAIDENIHIIDL